MADFGPVQPGPGVPPPPPPYAAGPVPARKKSRLPLILGIVVGALLLCCGGGTAIVVAAANSDDPVTAAASAVPTNAATPPPTVATTVSSTSPLTTPPTTAAATPSRPPETTVPPAPKAPAAPADIVYQGRGDKVVRLKGLADHAYYAVISHRGGSNFAVWSLDSGGGNIDLLVNEIGSYHGSRPLNFTDDPAALRIEAGGSWKVVVKALEKAPAWPTKTSGKGAAVLVIGSGAVDGLATARVTHKGSSNFVVHAYGDSVDLLVNEIGRYTGEVLIPSGTVAVAIEADGSWTMKPS